MSKSYRPKKEDAEKKLYPYGYVTVVGRMEYPSLSLTSVNFPAYDIPLTKKGKVDVAQTRKIYSDFSKDYVNTLIERAKSEVQRLKKQKKIAQSKLEAKVEGTEQKQPGLETKVDLKVETAGVSTLPNPAKVETGANQTEAVENSQDGIMERLNKKKKQERDPAYN